MQDELNIKAIRAELGLTQSAFAEEVGTDQGTVSAWERGKHKPTRAARKMIERLLEDRRGQAA